MKKIAILLFSLFFYQIVSAGSVEDGIVERIKKVGSVCVEGNDCAQASSGGAVADTGGGGEAIYKKSCATCHAVGVNNAPKLGDAGAWQPRIAKGMDVLYQSAIDGLPPGMPMKGLCFTCTDDDLRAAVDYMVDSTK